MENGGKEGTTRARRKGKKWQKTNSLDRPLPSSIGHRVTKKSEGDESPATALLRLHYTRDYLNSTLHYIQLALASRDLSKMADRILPSRSTPTSK